MGALGVVSLPTIERGDFSRGMLDDSRSIFDPLITSCDLRGICFYGIKLGMRIGYLMLLVSMVSRQASAKCERPVISEPMAAADANGRQVTLSWKTNVPADSLAAYGLAEAGIPTPVTDTEGVLQHSVTINDLLPGRRYAWAIRSRAIDAGSPCNYLYYAFHGGAGGETYFVTRPAPAAGPFDYYVVPVGPQHVTQGYPLYYEVEIGKLAGSAANNSLKIVLSGLPDDSSVSWTDSQLLHQPGTVSTTRVVNDTFTFYELRDTEIEILTTSSTRPGEYTITMTTSGPGLPTHVTTWPLVVDAIHSPFGISFPYGTPTSYPAIPNLARYKQSASTYGAINCAQDLDAIPRTIRSNNTANLTPVGGAVQKGSWYYDGLRVYYNIGDLLQDTTTWEQCRANVKEVYRDRYVLPNRGAIPAFVAFPEGYYIDYLRTGDERDLAVIDDLDLHTFEPVNGAMVSVRYLQRETAYALKVDTFASLLHRNNVRFAQGTHFWMTYHLDHVLGHVDQICLSRNAEYWESFMAGLEADALITYFEQVAADPRIPSAVKCLADYIYADAYNTISDDPGSFQYDKFRGATDVGIANARASSMVSLNLLIAPMFAWLFKETGQTQYQIQGDAIWNHGVLLDGAGGGLSTSIGAANGPPNGNSGKMFSEQYYWGPSYVTWRSAPVSPSPGPR
jgi:hypothetical protein